MREGKGQSPAVTGCGNGSTGRDLGGVGSRFPPGPAQTPQRPAPSSPVRYVLGGVLLVAGGGQDEGSPRRAQAPVGGLHPCEAAGSGAERSGGEGGRPGLAATRQRRRRPRPPFTACGIRAVLRGLPRHPPPQAERLTGAGAAGEREEREGEREEREGGRASEPLTAPSRSLPGVSPPRAQGWRCRERQGWKRGARPAQEREKPDGTPGRPSAPALPACPAPSRPRPRPRPGPGPRPRRGSARRPRALRDGRRERRAAARLTARRGGPSRGR